MNNEEAGLNDKLVTVAQVKETIHELNCINCCGADCRECEVWGIEEPLIKILESLAIINSIDNIQKARESESC